MSAQYPGGQAMGCGMAALHVPCGVQFWCSYFTQVPSGLRRISTLLPGPPAGCPGGG